MVGRAPLLKEGDFLNIELYKNLSQNNVVSKNITNKITIENVRFKENNSLNVSEPALLLNRYTDVDQVNGYNYVHIPKFNSYYYITSISWQGPLCEMHCKRDVLMSFRADIKNSTQYVSRQENNKNKYLVDNMLPIHSDHFYQVKTFGDNVEDITCNRVILETIGTGGVS